MARKAEIKRETKETCVNLVEHLHDFIPDPDCPVAPRVC